MSERGPEPSFDRGPVHARASDLGQPDLSPQAKAAAAEKLAENVEAETKSVRTHVTAMRAAVTTADRSAWSIAKQAADEGVKQLRRLSRAATSAVKEATAPTVRERLTAARQAYEAAKQLVAAAPAAPKARPPTLSCAGALLAALPPDPPPATWLDADFKAAEHAVAAIFTGQMTTSDIAAFRVMVSGEHHDEEIARRFHCLGDVRRKRLVEFLSADDVKWPARAREAALQRVARGSSPQTDPTPASDDANGADTSADSGDTAADAGSTASNDAGSTASNDAGSTASNEMSAPRTDVGEAAKAPAEPSNATAQAAPPREPHGRAIAALVPGATYEGDGVFRIASRDGHVTATVQRVRTTPRVRHGAGDHAVIEIPNGLSDAELVQAVADQLRLLQSQRSAAPAESAGSAATNQHVQRKAGDATTGGTHNTPPDAAAPGTSQPRAPGELGASQPDVAGQHAAPHPRSLEHLERELGPGASVNAGAAARMSPAAGADVSDARVHDGPVAAQMAAEHDAVALTVGRNILLGSGAPAAGSAAGDLLLSHELAHAGQQQDAAADPAARKRPIGTEDPAAEKAAGEAVMLAGTGARGGAMRTGLQVQRAPGPAKIIELQGRPAEDKLAELGGKLVTDPDFSDHHKAIVGSHVQYTVLGAASRTTRVGVHQWTHDGPDGFHMQSITGVSRPDPIPSAAVGPNGLFVNAHNVGSTTIPLSKMGTYRTRAWVRAGVDDHGVFVGYELYIDHLVEVTHIARAIHEAEQQLPRDTDSFEKFHDTMAVQTALLRPGTPDAQNRDHQFGVSTSAPNPSPIAAGALGFSAHDARKDPTKPVTYHWYVSAQTKDKPPETLGGRPMVAVAGRKGYDFGTGTAIAMPAEHAGFWVVWYLAKDAAGNDAGEASYVQTILSGTDMKSLEKHDQYMEHLDDLAGKIQGQKLPLRGVHVSEAHGNATQLRLFVGKKHGDTSTFMLIDATPGLDPKSNRLEYTSSSGPDVLEQFFSLNKYPKGRLRLNASPNSLGIDTHMYEKETSGQGTFDRLSSNLSVGGMVALGVGILAAPFTRGQSLQVAMVVAGGLNAAAGAVSLYERLHNAEVSGSGVALDIVTIASGLINVGGAIRGLAAGPGVLLANRATKFLLWANFIADGASALLIGAEGMQQLADIIDNDQLRPEQKREAVIRVVTNLIMAGAMLAVSYGQMREFRSKLESVLGKNLASKLSDEACMALSMLDDATLRNLKGVADHDLTKLGRAIREEPAVINLVSAEQRLSKILPLMKSGGAEDLRFAILRANAHEAGVAVANTERLVTFLRDAAVPAERVATWEARTFAKLASDPNTLTELEKILPLVKSGKITGLEDWLAFSGKKSGADAARTAGELREATRQSAANPSARINIGGDATAPANPTIPSETLQSFDMTVDQQGKTLSSVEVSSVGAPVKSGNDMRAGVRHAAEKVASRDAAGTPIPGKREATIQITLAKVWKRKGTERIEISSNGDRVLVTAGMPPERVSMVNIFDEFADKIGNGPNSALLDRVHVVDATSGQLLAQYECTGGTWKRVR
jgi:hypothetical protein